MHACSRAPQPHWCLLILAIWVGKQWVSLWVSFVFPSLLGNQAACHTCIGHLDFLICKWLKSFASFSIGSSVFLLITCRTCKKKYSGYKRCVSFICSRYFFPIWGLFLHSVRRSVYPAFYQNHSRQMSLNNYWPRLCSLAIRRLKVRYSQISKDLENQLERLGPDPRSKGVPQHVREHKREIMNKHLRKITLGVESQHESTELRKECGGYWSGWRLRSQGPRWRRWQWKEKGRDASKIHLEEKAEMMVLCYESVEEGAGDWKMTPSLPAQKLSDASGLVKEAHEVVGGVCFPPFSPESSIHVPENQAEEPWLHTDSLSRAAERSYEHLRACYLISPMAKVTQTKTTAAAKIETKTQGKTHLRKQQGALGYFMGDYETCVKGTLNPCQALYMCSLLLALYV